MFPGGKVGWCFRLTTLSPSCADCHEIGGVSTSWNPQGLSGNCFSYLVHSYICTKKTILQEIRNRSITEWNQLPEGVIGTSHGKAHIFKMRVRKV